MRHRYSDVPVFGEVVLSHHAQARAREDVITEAHVAEVLEHGRDTPEGSVTWREHKGIRLIIIKPTPWKGAYLVKTMFRVQGQAKVR